MSSVPPGATLSLSDNTFPSTVGPKHLEAIGRKKVPVGKRQVVPVSLSHQQRSLGPHFLTHTLPFYRHPTFFLGSGPKLSCPLTLTRCCRAKGGWHCAKASLELMRVQLCRCQCKIQESTRMIRGPHHDLGLSAPSSPSLARNQGSHPQKKIGRFRRIFQVQRVP